MNSVRRRLRSHVLIHGWGFRAEDVELYGFGGHDPRPLSDAKQFLGYDAHVRSVRPVLNQLVAHATTDNKWTFYRLAAGFDLPIPRTLGLFDPVFGVTWDGRPMIDTAAVMDELDRVRPAGVVLKPAGGIQGRDLWVFKDVDYSSGIATAVDGGAASLASVISELPAAQHRRYPGYIVQEAVRQHPFFLEIAPATVNTIRITTLLTSAGDVAVQMGACRFGRSGSIGDGWTTGGVSVGIDLETGTLGEGVLKPKYGGHRMARHPDTDEVFAGRQIPSWTEVIDLVKRAARLFPALRSLGWDIVVTSEGPVILETNRGWGIQMVQVHTNGYLALPGVREELEREGVVLPDGSWVARWLRSCINGVRGWAVRLLKRR